MSSVSKKTGVSKEVVRARRAPIKTRARKPVSEGIRRAAERAGIPMVAMPEPEFRSVNAQLKELTHMIVNAWATGDDGYALGEVLVKLHSARRNLESVCAPIGGAS